MENMAFLGRLALNYAGFGLKQLKLVDNRSSHVHNFAILVCLLRRSTDDWATRRLGNRQLGDKTFVRKISGRHGPDD